MLFILDNGHGTRDYTKGKQSPDWGDTPKIYEGEYARKVVDAIVEKAPEYNLLVQKLVPEKQDISLAERARRANALAQQFGKSNCLVVSVHLNASQTNKEAFIGWEIHTYIGQSKSDEYATIFWNKANEILPKVMPKRGDWSDGDPDWDSNFAILRDTVCPAVLTENMFMTSHNGCKFLNSEEGFNAVVKIHLEAMKEIASNHKI